MSRERWFRSDEVAAFDWYQPARDLDVPVEIARELYARAMRHAADVGAHRAEELYHRWLRDAALARRAALTPPPVPGRRTLVMHQAGKADRSWRLPEPGRLEPGRATRVMFELAADDHADDRSGSSRTPGLDDVHAAMAALMSGSKAPGLESQGAERASLAAIPDGPPGAASLRDQLLAAAASGRGAVAGLAGADPATVATTLRELEGTHLPGHTTPVLRLVARADDGKAGRMLGRGSVGAPLPADLATRLGPHVGGEAASAARLHTDDTADLVAAAHHARAVALGDAIYFARGEYAPGTERGDELLAHELTHVAQARRGDLVRAAAKGLDSGATLDPAEAEADLRAKLAVIELHPPESAVPPVAAPSGQPTSDGDRAAKIAAQQQRIALVNQQAQLEPAAPAPPASRPQGALTHTPPKMLAPPQPASTGNAYVDTFQAAPSKQATDLWAKAGGDATKQTAADQAKFDASMPPMPVVLDGSEVKSAKGGAAGAPPGKAPPPAGAVPPAAQPTPTPAAPTVTIAATAAQSIKPVADKAQMKTDAQKVIDSLPTTAPNVETSPGPAPVTELAGQADPVRTLSNQQHAEAEGAKALEAQKKNVIAGPGAAQVQPAKLDEKLTIPKEQPAGAMPQLPTVEGMTKFKKWNLPAPAQAAFDTEAKPKMEAQLAEGRAKMTQAEVKRDADRTKAVTDTQDRVKQATAGADKQQQTKVAETRTQIANHQADTLLKQENEIKKLDQQAGDKKKGTVGKINDRISADQAKVDADYKNAQKQAEDKKQQGEADAAKKKQEAEKKQEDQSWWDAIGDAVGDAVKAIADEIDKAIEAIGKAIGALIDAVKDAACKVIDAARDFVCQALSEFGDWLKSAVTALIGSVFPELAAALNQLIDSAVNAAKAAVNAIADGLKKAVTALCDGLKAAVDAAIAAFRAAVQAAATFVQALVTGDWSLVGKMILEGILKLLGIDPAAFYALIGKAQDAIDKIIDDPGAFVGHLIDAVKLGFKQFGDNFWTHLQNGLVQWLFGTFAQAGIQMPASFDIAGIFSLVAQILGLTWTRLRPKVVKLIGEQNTKRLEFVEKYVEALVTGGFEGLWEKIKQDMSSLWDMVVGGIKSWLIEKVVQQAIIKIATMWNPAGAIIQLIQTAWNVYCWVRENAQRIFGLIQAVVDSISNIANGNITGAANFIEASLAKLVPIAISLFANLLGLGGIADTIKGIIEKVQDTVDKAIDKLIARVMAMFTGKGASEGEGGDEDKKEIGARVQFNAGGHTHTQYIDATGPVPVAMVASTPTRVVDKIKEWRDKIAKLPTDKQGRAHTLVDEAKALDDKVESLSPAVKKGGPDTELRAAQQQLADKLLDLFIALDNNATDEAAQKRVLYAGLGDARRKLLELREANAPAATAATAPMPPPGDDFQVKYDRMIQTARALYQGRCAARAGRNGPAVGFTGNVFSFFGHNYFVDHDANYIIPDDPIGDGRHALDGKVYVFRGLKGEPLTNLAQLNNNPARDVIKTVAYNHFATSSGQLRMRLQNAVNGSYGDINQREGALMLAALIAEPTRDPNTDVLNQMAVNKQPAGTFKAQSPMVGGGGLDPDKKRDPALGGELASIIQLPSEKVTDAQLKIVRQHFDAHSKDDLAVTIEVLGSDEARALVAKYLLQDAGLQ